MTTQPLPTLGFYRHYKQKYYHLMGVATHSETGELLAVYRALHSEGSLWVRPLSMFLEKVMVEGVAKPRFAFVGSDPLSLPPSARNYLKEPILAPVGDEG